MNRVNQLDVVIEIGELCRELISEARDQLHYYRASVYKQDTAKQIANRVDKLRFVASLLNSEILLDAFSDHDAEKALGARAYAMGECAFSLRTSRLLTATDSHISHLMEQVQQRHVQNVSRDLSRNIYKHRRELLAICKQGSRQWDFFRSI
jgi:hypothetical protein